MGPLSLVFSYVSLIWKGWVVPHIHRPPKVWHHLEHRWHARVLIPILEYLLSMIIINWDYSVTINSKMYMNYVFDANLKDNKWLYILQGPFFKRLEIIANLTKIDILHSWPWIFMNSLNMKHSFHNKSLGDGLVRTVLIDMLLAIIWRRRWRHTWL